MTVKITRNIKSKKIELRFDKKPMADVLLWIKKENKFIWTRGGFWSRAYTKRVWDKVHEYFNIEKPTEVPHNQIKPTKSTDMITVDKYTLTIPEAFFVWATKAQKAMARRKAVKKHFIDKESELVESLRKKGLIGKGGRQIKETIRVADLIAEKIGFEKYGIDAEEMLRKLRKEAGAPKPDRKEGLAYIHPDIPINDLREEFNVGVDIEMEHQDKSRASQIAYDHLKEDPFYYSKLAVGELPDEKEAITFLKGREITISMPNREKRKAQFVIAELDQIITSHNEENFHSSPEYPKNAAGNNINDRNYKDDPAAQKAVMDYARELEPERLITTSRTPSGTPIITKDGFVVSGNNRTMSLKLAAKQYPDNYREYVKYLVEEIEAYGITQSIAHFDHPVLVRIDYDFPEYTTQELAKYNKDTKKAERPVDKAIKLSNILRDNPNCASIIAQTTGGFDTFTEFYASQGAEKKLANELVTCNLLTEQELPSYFTGATFTETGKEFVENLLASLILNRDALIASELPGIKGMKQKLITALPVLMRNASLPEGSLKENINGAILLQQNIKASENSFYDWIRQHKMFEGKYDRKTVYLNRLLDSGKFKFKKAIEGYNDSVEKSQGASMFGDKPSLDEIFDHHIKANVDEVEQRLIEGSEIITKTDEKPGKKKEYRYIMRLRPFDIGTYPEKGFIRYEPEGGKYGTVIYDRKLPVEEWDKWDFWPETEVNELASKDYSDEFYELNKLKVLENGMIEVQMFEKASDKDYTDKVDLSAKDLIINIETGYFKELEDEKPEEPEAAAGPEFKVGDFVANTRTKTIGEVIDVFDRGEVRTDMDGVVSVSELKIYNPDEHNDYELIRSPMEEFKKKRIEAEGPRELETMDAELSENLLSKKYENSFDLNKDIEKLLDNKWKDHIDDWTVDEIEFISRYSGYGGLDKFGEISRGSLFEYYTPDLVIEKMWGLAYKYGYKDGSVLEPSVGVGSFFNRKFVPEHVYKVAYETNKYSAKIVSILYPEVIINDDEKDSMYFEEVFLKNNYTVRDKVGNPYSLVIGNPPYGAAEGKWINMGEKQYTHAKNYIDYFIFRGLDLLAKDGLLIYIVGAEVAAGAKPWLDQGTSKTKEMIAKKADLIDAYRLPNGVFERTDVVSDIIIMRKII